MLATLISTFFQFIQLSINQAYASKPKRTNKKVFPSSWSLLNGFEIGQITLLTHISFGQTLSKSNILQFLSMVDGYISFWREHETK